MQKEAIRISLKKSWRIALMAFLSGACGSAQAQGIEHEVSVMVPIPSFQMNTCQVGILTESHQRDELARVLTKIEQESCATTSVTYELSITIVDSSNQYQNLLFSETWEQEKDSPVEFSRDYPIGKNMTLKRVMDKVFSVNVQALPINVSGPMIC